MNVLWRNPSLNRSSGTARLVFSTPAIVLVFFVFGAIPLSVYAAFGDGVPTIFNSDPFTDQSSFLRVDGPTGAFTQQVPIVVPPGRNGMQPSVSLEYNSQRTEDSIVGYGWGVSIPYIQRFSKTGSQDLYSSSVTFSSSLDGELARTTATSSLYRARVDAGAFNAYLYSNNTWTVYDKKGTKYLFGVDDTGRQYDTGTGTSTQTYKWMLQEIRDVNDNYVKFTYTRDSNEVYPNQITYTGRGTTDGPFAVTFATSTRTDVRVSYKTGFKVTTNKRISEIDTLIGTSTAAKYLLSYGTGSNGKRSLLISVQQQGYDESNNLISLPATTFNYASSSTQFISQSGGGMQITGPSFVVADVNGNGINDVTDSHYNVDTVPPAAAGQVLLDQTSSSVATIPEYWSYVNYQFMQWSAETGARFFDINGDGKADVVKGNKNDQASTRTATQSLGNGNSTWTATTTFTGAIPAFSYTTSGGTTLSSGIFGDVNGDGLSDFVMALSAYTGDYTYLGNQSAFATSSVFAPVYEMPTTSGTAGNASQLIDVNGDGLSDWMYSDSSNTYVRLNTGTGWENSAATQWTIATSTYYTSTLGADTQIYDRGVRFQDINGDGLPDFIRGYSVTAKTICTTTAPPEYASFYVTLLNTGNGWATSTAYGAAGIVNGWLGGTSSGPCGAQALNHNEYGNWTGNGQMAQDVMTSVTSSLGGIKTVDYAPSAQLGTNANLPVSLLVVTATGQNDGFGNIATTTYAYSGGKIYTAGGAVDRKFAGFAVSTTTAPDGTTVTYYSQGTGLNTSIGEQSNGFAQINRAFRSDVFDPTGVLTQRTYYRWDTGSLASSTLMGLGKELTLDFGPTGLHKDRATEYTYASTTTNDLIKKTEYGEVTSASDGTFSDIGSDKRITDITYAATSSATTTQTGTSGGTLGLTKSLSLTAASSQYASRADTTSLSVTGDLTLEAWVKFTTLPGTSGVGARLINKFSSSGSNRGDYELYVNNSNKLDCIVSDNGTYDAGHYTEEVQTTATITSTGVWYHVKCIFAASTHTLTAYVNGSAVATTNLQSGGTSVGDQNYPIGVGARIESGSAAGFLDGKISLARVWAEQHTNDDKYTVKGPTTNLAAEWTLDNTYNDNSGNSNTLTANNSPTFATDAPVNGAGAATTTDTFVLIDAPAQETLTNQSGTKIKETRHYYDGLALNSVSKGSETKTESYVTGSTYINTQRAFNTYGLVASSTDPRGNITTNTYDSYNLYIATSSNPLSQTTQFYYDYTQGKAEQTIDPNGLVFRTTFDGLDRPLTESQPDLVTPSTLVTKKTYAYTDTIGSRKVLETNYLDGSTSFTLYKYLDGFDRPIQSRKQAETSSQFSVTDLVYNPVGLLQKSSFPYFSSNSSLTTATTTSSLYTAYTYDPLKRVASISNALGTTTTVYDAWSATTTDANGNNKGLIYDAFKRLAKVIEYNAGTSSITQYDYDVGDNLTKVTDTNGNLRNFTYDGRGNRLTAEDLHDAADGTFGSWSYVYDNANNLASTTDPKSQLVNYSYDALNRVSTEDYTGLAGTEVSYGYDTCSKGKSLLCSATSTGATSIYTYNALGLPATESKTIGTSTFNTTYSYNRQGNLTDIIYPDSSEVQYTYNVAGLLESVQQKESGGTFTNVVSNFDYAPTEKVTTKAFGNGVTSTYTYDPAQLYRLTKIYTSATSTGVSLGGGGGFAFARNIWSNLARVTEELPLAVRHFFKSSQTFAVIDPVATDTPPVVDPVLEEATTTPDRAEIQPVEATSTESAITEDATSTPAVVVMDTASTTSQMIEPLIEDVTFKDAVVPFVTEDASSTVAFDISTSTTDELVSTQRAVKKFDIALAQTLLDAGAAKIEMRDDTAGVRLQKWDGQMDVGVSYNVPSVSKGVLASSTVTWEGAGQSLQAYPLAPKRGMEDGGLELEVVLNEKPSTNEFSFQITGADNLDFFYQPALTEEEIKEGAERPENVVGSYAVYYKDAANHAEQGTDYGTGKAFHIFRPRIVDAKDNAVWGTLNYKKGQLTVTVPQDFLDSAVYPVKVDPTFGYGVAGASVISMNQDAAIASMFNLTEASTTVSKITVYERVSATGTRNLKGLLYANSAGYPGALLGTTTVHTVANTTPVWQDLVFPTPLSIATSSSYWLGFAGDSGSPTQQYYYDTGATNQTYTRNASSGDYASPPNPYTAGATGSARKISIYATYTTVQPTSISKSLNLVSASSQYASRADTASLSITGDLTVETWVKFNTLPSTSGVAARLINKFSSSGSLRGDFELFLNTANKLEMIYTNNGTYDSGHFVERVQDTASITSTGVWYHVRGVAAPSTGTITLYVNGASVPSTNSFTGATTIADDDYPIGVGARIESGSAAGFLDGKLSLTRIWSSQHTAYDLYSIIGTNSNLKAEWTLDNTYNDNSGNSNTLTSHGSPTFASDVPVTATSSAPGPRDGIQNITLTYDPVGNITQVTDTSATANAHGTSYTYDNLYRLTGAATSFASSTPYSEVYAYDPLGSITAKTGYGSYMYQGTTTGNYANPHAATKINGLAVAYDKNGNMTNYASTTNAWDYKNRLSQSFASSSPTVNYWYDHSMNRVLKGNTVATTSYPSMYFNTEGATTTNTKHIFTPDGDLLATVIGSGTGAASTTKQYVHSDWLGSVNVITSASGTVARIQDYMPYGSDRINSGSTTDQRGYIQGEKDQQTGNQYLNNRYYEAGRGKFLSEDPVFWEIGQTRDGRNALLDPQSQNSYSYASNNPINKKDPDGRWYIEAGFDKTVKVFGFELIGAGGVRFNGQGAVTYSSASAGAGTMATFPIRFNSGDINVFKSEIESSPEGTFAAGPSITYSRNKYGQSNFGVTAGVGGWGGVNTTITSPLFNFYSNRFAGANTVEARAQVVQSFNAAGGGSSLKNESKYWTTPNGAVITWGGAVVVPGIQQSNQSSQSSGKK